MKWLNLLRDIWLSVLRDMVLIGAAVWTLAKEVDSQHPSDSILLIVITLTAPSIADHAKALLSGPGAAERSQPPQEQPPSPSGGQSEG